MVLQVQGKEAKNFRCVLSINPIKELMPIKDLNRLRNELIKGLKSIKEMNRLRDMRH